MSDKTLLALSWTPTITQPCDLRRLPESERDSLIVTATQVDGQWVLLSRYADDIWHLDGFTSNRASSDRRLDFSRVPPAFRAVVKAMFYRHIQRGRGVAGRPRGSTTRQLFNDAMPFLRHLEMLKLGRISAVTPMICEAYVASCKAHLQAKRSKGEPLSPRGLVARFTAVEVFHELSQYTDDPMPQHPWPETSGRAMAGTNGEHTRSGKTPLIPDDVFCTLFGEAHHLVERGHKVLNLRDELDTVAAQSNALSVEGLIWAMNRHLSTSGWEGGLKVFKKALVDLRTACYIVLASTSGCRNHELANLQSGAERRTEDDEGIIYHWMRSRSDKTDVGIHDWMIPEAAVRALRLMERWSVPYQAMIAAEIVHRRRANPLDPQIAEALEHRHSLFLGVCAKANNQVRTLSNTVWNLHLNAFAKKCGLSWKLSSHQFRRKFANYAAHSRFGDLRYLKEHYAHWSMDMTLGYAMDDGW